MYKYVCMYMTSVLNILKISKIQRSKRDYLLVKVNINIKL